MKKPLTLRTGSGSTGDLSAYELKANKENTTIDNNTTKYPTVNLLKTGLDAKVDENAPITPGTHMKISYDAKGLVTSGADAALDDLSDTVITAPSNGQALVYDGSQWINGAQPAAVGTGVSLYFDDTASDISTYFSLLTSPSNHAEELDSRSVTSATSPLLIEAYATPHVGINRDHIDAGEWAFYIWANTSNISNSNTILIRVYKRTSGGTETLLFSASTPQLTTTLTQYTIRSVQQEFTGLNLTDRVVIKLYAVTTGVSARTISFTHNGTDRYSFLTTPIIITHNELTGLQGGSSDQYYHLTNSQHTVATQAASVSLNGYLTSTDWSTFNGKQNALGFTPENVSNKENTTIDTSTTKYPTVNLLKTGLDLKQDVIAFKSIEFDYRIKITNNIIIVQNTTADIILELPTIKYAYKKIFNIVNETSFKVTLQARDFDTFYNGSSTVSLNTNGEAIQIAAYKGWHILSKFVP